MLTQVWAACKRGVRAVNVFKKKSCGASLCKSETVLIRKEGTTIIVNLDIKSTKLWAKFCQDTGKAPALS